MKVFVAGASGAIGLPLVRGLARAGHEVTGSTRGRGAERIREAGGVPVTCDAFDREGLVRAMTDAAPDVVVNQLTSLPQRYEPRKRGYYDANNRIRSEGGDNVIAATAESGARRLVTQSISFLYALEGGWVKTEDDPVDRTGAHAAMLGHESRALSDDRFETVVLRYGLLYGPGTWYARDGHLAEEVRRRRLPVVGKGTGITSFLHVEDAASAAVLAVERGDGVYNVTDDDPAPMSEWLPRFADAVGAKPPRRVSVWLATLVAGRQLATVAVEGRGASNEKAKHELGWEPEFPSWREGFATL